MSVDQYEYRRRVLDVLSRLTSIEERLQAKADARGDDVLEAIHEHGALVLREAQSAVRGLGHE